MTSKEVVDSLKKVSDEGRRQTNMWFFKTEPGQYGHGDMFLGVTMPNIRKVAKANKKLELKEVEKLLDDKLHEVRMAGLVILNEQFKRADSEKQAEIFEFYQDHTYAIDNWDLVDVSAPHVPGPYLYNKDRSWLYELVKSKNMWEQRISIISTYYFIRRGDFGDALNLSEKLLRHEHDLIHKAVGWMLREIGKVDRSVEDEFLKKHYKSMPRTMLRYAIEKHPENIRQDYLKGRI